MSIDEAIAHAKEVANEQKRRSGICVRNNSECDKFSACLKCSKEHEQLAEWLEELKDYQDKNKMVVRVDVENMNSIKDKTEELLKYAESQYNKALDDLLEDANEMAIEVDADTYTMKAIGIGLLENIAEQLKAGGNS